MNIKRAAEDVIAAYTQYEDDLKACHEYYCKYNCGLLMTKGTHTPRCERIRLYWHFPTQDPPSRQDGELR